MSKVKLDERMENAINALFEREPEHGSFSMQYAADNEIVMADTVFSEKFGKWSNILRELFLFGPGTFFLYYMTLVVIFFYPTIGLQFGGLFLLSAAAFMTYAGSGDIRNTKNLAVPATVISIAAAVSLVRSIFPVPEYLNPYFSYALYSFPLALIAAKLVQMWLSEKK